MLPGWPGTRGWAMPEMLMLLRGKENFEWGEL